MSGPEIDAAALLNKLSKRPAEEHAAMLCAAGPLAEVFRALAEETEKLAMTEVMRALQASEWLVGLADVRAGPLEQARVRRARAQSLAYAGRFDEALPDCEAAARLAERAAAPIETACAWLAMVHPLVHLARYDEAIAAGLRARCVFAAAGNQALAARADSSIGGAYQKKGDPAAALRHFDRARPHLEHDPVACAQLDTNRGLALLAMDDFAGAEHAYRAALPAFEQGGLDWAVAIVENNLAEVAARQGRLCAALNHFERTRRHLDRDKAPAELARVLVEHADALVMVGLQRQALRQYRAAQPILRRHGQVREALQSRTGIAGVLAMNGRHAGAERILARTARRYRELGLPGDEARVDLLRAEIARTRGRPIEAIAIAAGALRLLDDRPAAAAAARYQIARAALAAGDRRACEEALGAALPAAQQLGLSPLTADLLHVRGLLSRADGDFRSAIADLRTAVELIERLRGSLQAQRFRAAFLGSHLALYTDLVVASLDSGTEEALEVAFATAERVKSRALLDQVRGAVDVLDAPAPFTRDAAERALRTEWSALRAELNAVYSRLADARFANDKRHNASELIAAAQAREQRVEVLEGRLASARGVPSLYAPPAKLAAVRARLPAGTALVEYFAADDELLAFVVHRDGTRVVRGLARLREIAEHVERFYFQVRRALRPRAMTGHGAAGRVDDARRVLEALHLALIAPISTALDGADRLLIVPHAATHRVPFHALWDGRQYLIERFEIAYGPSASLLCDCSPHRAADFTHDRDTTGQTQGRAGASAQPPPITLQAKPTPPAALVVGVADDLAPQIEQEAADVAAVLGTERVLLGSAATAAAVRASVQGCGLIHFACHGHFDPVHANASGLRLADGWLTLRDIYDLPLDAGLVTLSGCETGRNTIDADAGDELYGLVRAFLAAGAHGLLVSLWPAHDACTAELMKRFYNQQWIDAGRRRAGESLRAAQRELLRSWPHPAHWAPFILVGDL